MKMVPFDDALNAVINLASPLGEEMVDINLCHNRVLASDIKARSDMPKSDVSAMDGYAVKSNLDISKPLMVIGESFAGSDPCQKFEGTGCIRIFTGAPVPTGYDRVIIQENAQREGDVVKFAKSGQDGDNIRKCGNDFKAGDSLLPKGTRLNWRQLTSAAAADFEKVSVYRKPRVSLIATGDELAPPGHAYKIPGAIPESVSLAIAAYVNQEGGHIVRKITGKDDLKSLSETAAQTLDISDIVIVLGGASVGAKDFARSMFGDDLNYVFPKVAMKPGKPVWLAKVSDTLVLGLPGNPGSALVTARLFLAPLIAGLTGLDAQKTVQFTSMICADPLPPCGDRETFLRARLEGQHVHLFSNQSSGSQSVLGSADILIRRKPFSDALAAGSSVEVITF